MIHSKIISLNKESHWNDLIRLSRTATFFQQQQWLQIWVKHFPIEYEIVGIFDDDNLIGIAPISFDNEKVYLMGTTPVLGKEQVTDFGDIICLPHKEKVVWDSFLDYVSKKYAGKVFSPCFIKENSPNFDILKSSTKNVNVTATSPYLNVPKSWENYLAMLDRKDRHELRRKFRKLESTDFRVYQAQPTQTNQQTFFRLMKQSTPEKEIFLSAPMESFFSDILSNFNNEQVLLWFMDIENKTVAGVIAFRFKKELLLYNSGMDLNYKYLSVGLLSKALLIKHAIGLGLNTFDFLQGNESYKYNLGGVDNKLYQFMINL